MKPNKISLLVVALVLFTVACMCTGTSAIPTVQPAASSAPAATSAPAGGSQPVSSGFITDVVMAKNTQGAAKDPVDPTTVFTPTSVIHAVVQTKDAPANTKFTAEFYVVDVGTAASPNTLITSTDLTVDGTHNIDFTLTPTTSNWPAGSYRVDISVNGTLDTSVTYTVQ
jgi:hypothetical protein